RAASSTSGARGSELGTTRNATLRSSTVSVARQNRAPSCSESSTSSRYRSPMIVPGLIEIGGTFLLGWVEMPIVCGYSSGTPEPPGDQRGHLGDFVEPDQPGQCDVAAQAEHPDHREPDQHLGFAGAGQYLFQRLPP